MLLMLSAHPSRRSDLLTEDRMHFSPHVKARNYNDAFGNICTRLVAPPGLLEIRNDLIIADSGLPDEVAPDAEQWPIDALPDDALVYLLGSRYCDTQKLSEFAWSMFGRIRGGWARAQAICQYVHDRIQFGYHYARDDRTAAEGHEERIGVCRDFAHLAIALGRCMNIPARRPGAGSGTCRSSTGALPLGVLTSASICVSPVPQRPPTMPRTDARAQAFSTIWHFGTVRC